MSHCGSRHLGHALDVDVVQPTHGLIQGRGEQFSSIGLMWRAKDVGAWPLSGDLAGLPHNHPVSDGAHYLAILRGCGEMQIIAMAINL